MSNTKQDWLEMARSIFHKYGLSYSEITENDKLLNSYVSMGIPEFNTALEAITQQIEKEVVEARIDELNKLFDKPSSNSDFYSVPIEWVSKRLAQLKDISTKLGEK